MCVCLLCMCLGTRACDLFQNTNVPLISSAYKKNPPCWDCGHSHTHTRTHACRQRHTHTQTHKGIYVFICILCAHAYLPAHRINIVVSPRLTAEQGLIYAHTHTHQHPPGRLIYFNYRQIHRDPITKIEEYLFFPVHPKRLIKFSCKDEIM